MSVSRCVATVGTDQLGGALSASEAIFSEPLTQLANNMLSALPREIGLLPSLKVLIVNDNRLVSVPAELGSLKLKGLNVRAPAHLSLS
jgi:hypothetical protein